MIDMNHFLQVTMGQLRYYLFDLKRLNCIFVILATIDIKLSACSALDHRILITVKEFFYRMCYVFIHNEEYLNMQGKNYTVERLMPTPYNLSINADIWSTNTDQKLQILEQILMLFNPSLEIQTTDNFVDWTSLSVVNLENITFSIFCHCVCYTLFPFK